MEDLDRELGTKSPEEWLSDVKKHRDELRTLDAEIKSVEEQMAAYEGRLRGLKARRESTRKLGEHAFAMIAKSVEQGH
jgi:capsule polysaccharide export protein KpsE/RkpR